MTTATGLKISEADKSKLRKIKLVSPVTDAARNTLVKGCLGDGLNGAYVQFGKDVPTYGLWEGLLYAHGYEQDGHYAEGTTQKALDAAIQALRKQEGLE